jgi:hypothetical protein
MMLLIRTRLDRSRIHGTGVFADEAIAECQLVWRYDPVFDRRFSQAEVDAAGPAVRDFLTTYAYRSSSLDGGWLLSGDHARFLNHSGTPNTVTHALETFARRSIAAGDEITCDYGAFCADWDPAELGDAAPPAPHAELYTRIAPSAHGVGVFAIRDIPAGKLLFEGDDTPTVHVPVSAVEAITDDAVRRMYLDFCPERDGSFIAPARFNQLTMAWHLNHSDTPNVRVRAQMRLVASRLIRDGEELTTDYATYSDSFARLRARWEQ